MQNGKGKTPNYYEIFTGKVNSKISGRAVFYRLTTSTKLKPQKRTLTSFRTFTFVCILNQVPQVEWELQRGFDKEQSLCSAG